jgi:hypothetical protein
MERLQWDAIPPQPLPGPLLVSLKCNVTTVYAKYFAIEESIPECGALLGCARTHVRVS